MNLSRLTDRIKFKASTVYNYLNNPINYESILIDEISEFSMINEKSFAIKIGSLPKLALQGFFFLFRHFLMSIEFGPGKRTVAV